MGREWAFYGLLVGFTSFSRALWALFRALWAFFEPVPLIVDNLTNHLLLLSPSILIYRLLI